MAQLGFLICCGEDWEKNPNPEPPPVTTTLVFLIPAFSTSA